MLRKNEKMIGGWEYTKFKMPRANHEASSSTVIELTSKYFRF
jgi:hypothetical protein